MTDPILDDEDDNPAAETKISVVSFAGRIENARAMADNILKTPASEQNITHIQTFAAQAIRDLTDVVEDLDARLTAEAPADPTEISIDTIRLNHFIVNTCRFQIDMATGETHCRDQVYKTLRDAIDADLGVPAETGVGDKSYECIVCGTAIDSETVDRNLERCDPCAAAGKTDETGYPDADAIAEDKRERETDQADRCMEEIVDWCTRMLPHFKQGPEFKIAKAFDDELREICRWHIGDVGAREPDDKRVAEIARDIASAQMADRKEPITVEAISMAISGGIYQAFAEYHSALRTQRSEWYRKYSAEQTARAMPESIRHSSFVRS